MNSALLVLEDEGVFSGSSIGIEGVAVGPLFFDTRVVGFQEVITDPANAGKILMFTYPLIGNYGINDKFNESGRAWVKGLVIKEKSRMYSNWQAKGSLDDFLKKENLVALSEVDTRTLAVHLRDKGEVWAALSTNGKTKEELLKEVKLQKQKPKPDLIKAISVEKIKVIKGKTKTCVGILDLGVTQSLLRQLNNLGLEIVLLPYDTGPQEILKLKLKGLIISGGPEDDPILENIVAAVRKLIGKIPLLGIALGSQVIAKSLGAEIKKIHLGHHGVNYPIKYPSSYQGDITVQNHSWVVDAASLKKIKGVEITALHLNDETVEGYALKKHKIIAVQYNPVSPGFDEINRILIEFLRLMKGKK